MRFRCVLPGKSGILAFVLVYSIIMPATGTCHAQPAREAIYRLLNIDSLVSFLHGSSSVLLLR